MPRELNLKFQANYSETLTQMWQKDGLETEKKYCTSYLDSIGNFLINKQLFLYFLHYFLVQSGFDESEF